MKAANETQGSAAFLVWEGLLCKSSDAHGIRTDLRGGHVLFCLDRMRLLRENLPSSGFPTGRARWFTRPCGVYRGVPLGLSPGDAYRGGTLAWERVTDVMELR